MSNKVRVAKKEKANTQRVFTETVLLQFPIYLVVMILPLIVGYQKVNTGLGIFDWYPDGGVCHDFFLYFKQWFFAAICAVILVIIILRAVFNKKTLKWNKLLLPMIVYIGLVILSTMFSKYSIYGLKGMTDQFENVFCVVGYAIVAYYTWQVVESEQELRYIVNAYALGALLLGTLGFFQSLCLDFFSTETGKTILGRNIIPKDKISMVFGKGRVYASLYNPNYVGVYTVMTIALFSVMLLFAKKRYEYILYYLVILTSSFSLFGAQFKVGIVCMIITFIMTGIALRKQLKNRWYIGLIIIGTLVSAMIITNKVSNHAYTTAINDALHNMSTPTPNLEAIDTKSNGVEVQYKGATITAYLDENHQLKLTDNDGKNLELTFAKAVEGYSLYGIEDPRFQEICPILYEDNGEEEIDFCLYIEGHYWAFQYNEEQKTYLYYNQYGKFCPIESAESAIFDGHESFASGRGYIWGRTIPLLKKHIFLGSGADTFVIEFPQHDFVGLANAGFEYQLMTKPHCLYLQIGVQSGVLSLLCFLIFFLLYAIWSIRLYIQNSFATLSSKVGVGAFISVVGFLISGVSNDSSICVSPVFWVVVGLGIAANLMQKGTAVEKA